MPLPITSSDVQADVSAKTNSNFDSAKTTTHFTTYLGAHKSDLLKIVFTLNCVIPMIKSGQKFPYHKNSAVLARGNLWPQLINHFSHKTLKYMDYELIIICKMSPRLYIISTNYMFISLFAYTILCWAFPWFATIFPKPITSRSTLEMI